MIDVGIGLYSMQSTAGAPASWTRLYLELQTDAALVDELGFHSVWIAEHHFWYDGWCPSSLVAAAAALGATSRLRVGLGLTALPLQELGWFAPAAGELHRLSGGRLEVGVGLGYRLVEYDGFGVPRSGAGQAMARALDELVETWGGEGPRLWVGGIAEASIRRATRRGLSLLLPQTLRDLELGELIAAAAPSRAAVIRYARVTDGGAAERRAAEEAIVASAREYAGAWWKLAGEPAFDRPDLLERQMQRNLDTALIGTTAEIAAGLAALESLGVELAILQLVTEGTRPAHRDGLRRLAAELAA